MITESQKNVVVGRTGELTTKEGLIFKVKILNLRAVFGREDILIAPLHGTGEAWVASHRVQLLDK